MSRPWRPEISPWPLGNGEICWRKATDHFLAASKSAVKTGGWIHDACLFLFDLLQWILLKRPSRISVCKYCVCICMSLLKKRWSTNSPCVIMFPSLKLCSSPEPSSRFRCKHWNTSPCCKSEWLCSFVDHWRPVGREAGHDMFAVVAFILLRTS